MIYGLSQKRWVPYSLKDGVSNLIIFDNAYLSLTELDEAIHKINQLIEELSSKNPPNNTSDNMKIAVAVVERIENNITWKQKSIKACKKGLLESMKSNPIGAFVAGAIEGWKGS